jgi:NitT/TauT family transport system substrate-binding protein
MKRRRGSIFVAALLALSLIAAACGDDDDDSAETATDESAESGDEAPADDGAAEEGGDEAAADDGAAADGAAEEGGGGCAAVDSVKLQLQWLAQAQFAGYYAAVDQGFYGANCLEVEIIELTDPSIVPQQQLADGAVDFAIAWVPKALQTREAGANIVNIAQVFQRSGTLQVSFTDAGITSPEDFAGKTIGTWGFGNEYEVYAALGQAGLDPAADVTLVNQDFNMNALLAGDIDAAEAMTYNEYAQVLEAVNADTGELYQPADFNVISYEEAGVGMLQDAIWADGARLEDPAYRDIAVRFVAASLQGWAYCRDNVESCRDIVVGAGSQLGASHQLWQMNEINKLIWPSPSGVGTLDVAAWDRTVGIAQNTPNLEGTTVLTAAPTDGAYVTDIVAEAQALLTAAGIDINGEGHAPIEVTLNEGGA